jgi:hypothetical protein
MTFRGLCCPPKRLVRDATRRLCEAVQRNNNSKKNKKTKNATTKPVKYVLMNTAGNSNRDNPKAESISCCQSCVLCLLRCCLPPHVDNEQASDYLRVQIGQQHDCIEWACVRPDDLLNEHAVTPFTLHAAPTRSAIFNSGKTSRINVAAFMADLALDTQDAWKTWRGRMPVIYNAEHSAGASEAKK